MTITAQLTFLTDELKNILIEAISPLSERIRELEITSGTKKHAYTVSEVAAQIGYSKPMILQFIKDGRSDSRGRKHRLKHKEITRGDYRVLPSDLDEFLSHF